MVDLADLNSRIVDAKYRVERMLGRGGMGAVFLATHVGTGRAVALKIIVPRFASDPTFLERFKREALAAGRVRHPNVVDVTDFGFAEIDGQDVAYLVMEYLDGCSLEEVLAEQATLPVALAVDVVEQLCLGVGELHRKGIVHRDLKPSNMWLEPNYRGGFTVKVLDFGLAKLRTDAAPVDGGSAHDTIPAGSAPLVLSSARTLPALPASAELTSGLGAGVESPAAPAAAPELTQAGSIFGTPAYMSPEQCLGEPAGPESDVYSIGVIAYQMLAGGPPFAGNQYRLFAAHITDEPDPIFERNPDVSRSISEVVATALAKNQAARPASPELFAAALRAKAEGTVTTLRRGLVVTLEQLPVFTRIVVVLLAPFYLAIVAHLALEAATSAGLVSVAARPYWRVPLGVAETVTVALASVLARGVAALVVGQLLAAPSRPVRVALAFASLRRVLGPALGAAALLAAILVVPTALASELMRFAVKLAVQASTAWDVAVLASAAVVAAMVLVVGLRLVSETLQVPNAVLAEGIGVRASLGRSMQLARRAPVDSRIVAALVVVYTAIPWIIISPAEAVGLAGSVAGMLAVAAIRTVALVVVPVLVAVLYFKQRLAAGEPVHAVLAHQYVAEPLPTSRWERRLDSSLASRSGSGEGSGAPSSG